MAGGMTESAPGGRLIGAGRNADVYDIGGGRVLRRYRDGRPEPAVAREAEVMAHARAAGAAAAGWEETGAVRDGRDRSG